MPQQLIGVVSCSGECCYQGTLSRIATRLVMEELRQNSITICLPLFSAGDTDEHEFAKTFPTITVDGCEKKCASIATERLSGPIKDHLVITEVLKEWGITREFPRRELDEEGVRVARRLAQAIAEKVDEQTAPQRS